MEDKKKLNFEVNKFFENINYYLKLILALFVGSFMIMTYFFKPVTISGSSMYPTLKNKEFGVSNIFESIIHHYHRFDIVVVDAGDKALNSTSTLWVKRIIGLPGETIEYHNDKLYINGKNVEETYLNKEYVKKITLEGDLNFTDDFGPVTLGEDEYFVMGDNRQESYDSRYVGPINEDEIISKSIVVLYPFDSISIHQ